MNDIELSPEEIQTSRTAAEFYLWVHARIESIAATPEGKAAIRFRKGLCKPLIEELLPLGLMCEMFFGRDPDVCITPVLGSQNYDATVSDRRQRSVNFCRVEVTQGHEGEDEYLRILHLEREGHTNLLGHVNKSGTKRTGISVSVTCEAKRHTEVVARQVELVWSAIEKKLEKEYESCTALLVVFDDSIAIQYDSDCGAFRDLLEKHRATLRAKFDWVGVIGWGQKCFAFVK